MKKSELKKEALDSINIAGEALQKGQYKKAQDYAEKAWNYYYELQKQRNEDEDFSDLIYWARDLYQKAEAGLAETQAHDTAPAVPEADYLRIKKLALGGYAGNAAAALEAAQWYLDQDIRLYLTEKGSEYLKEAHQLLQKVLENESATSRQKALASITKAMMYSRPMYLLLNIDEALKCAKFAASVASFDTELSKDEKYQIFCQTEDIALIIDDINYAYLIALKGEDNGFDKGIYYPICRYLYRNDEQKAKDLEDKIYQAGVWQGKLLHGQTLLFDWESDFADEKGAAMTSYANDHLGPYGDDHIDSYGGRACLGLACYIFFLQYTFDILDNEDIMETLINAANDKCEWSNYYLGLMYDVAAQLCKDNGKDAKIDEYKEKAIERFFIGAGLGHRGCIIEFINMLKAGYGDQKLLPIYKDIASKLNINVD